MADEEILHPRTVRTALRRSLLAEPFLAGRFSFSPYMACGHGCTYCDGRAERYWVDGEFDRDIVVRSNLIDVLRREVGRLRERAVVSVGSGISDGYQPVERTQGLMRGAAEVLRDACLPVTLLTKSTLVRRDLDVWSQVARKAGFNLFVSLTFWDDEQRRLFEPGASCVAERLETLRVFRAAGAGTGVYALPLLPWISDTPESLERLLALCRQAGADFVMPAGLTLRPGRQKEFFLERLGRSHPDLVGRYRDLYGEDRPSGACRSDYGTALQERVRRALERHGFASLPPHPLYRGRLPLYDELYVLLCHMGDLYARRGAQVARLRSGLGAYRDWLVARKRRFNRCRGETQADVEGDLRSELRAGSAITGGNERLAAFLRRVAFEGQVLDYVSLELRGA